MAEQVMNGDEKSAARLISLVERGGDEGHRELRKLFPLAHRAHVVGVTGPPGAGKSTVIGKLAVSLHDEGRSVAVIAVDPTSVKTKGALLGDRLRMKEAEKKTGIFIRSMADRNYPGGISQAAIGAVYVMEGLGKDVVLIESVGAGQSDKAILSLADTVVTLFTPDYGDEIQLMKAGLLEIGDIVVLNKTDKAGAETTERALSASVQQPADGDWFIPVITMKAQKGEGVEALRVAVEAHWKVLRGGKGKKRRGERIEAFMMGLLKEEVWKRFSEKLGAGTEYQKIRDEVRAGKLDPYTAVDRLLQKMEDEGRGTTGPDPALGGVPGRRD